MYEGGLKVPACAVWPNHIKPGTRSNLRAISMDIYPTVCEAAGAKIPAYVEGTSFMPTLLGRQQEINRDLVFVRREGGARYNGQDYHAIRRGDWKLVHNQPDEPLRLYNLKNDPLETTDLAEKNRQMYNTLKAALRLHYQRAGRVPWQKPPR